jgi:uncharacterized protein (DUF2252 family)
MPHISSLTRQILAQNAGRDLDRLRLKLARLRQDPFAFYRGTNALFLSFLPRRHALFRAPLTLVCGDLHVENFGAFKADNRLCYFDINDFDEACVAPFTLDIVRFLASVRLAAGGLGLGRAQIAAFTRVFLDAYMAAIHDGKPRWIERSLAGGVFRQLLRQAMRRTRREFLDRFSKRKNGKRRLRIDGVRTLAVDAAERPRLARFLVRCRRAGARPAIAAPFLKLKPSFFKLLDAARRIAGNGSLGLPRYVLLVQGRGSPDQNFALDLKFAAPSATAEWLGDPQPAWSGEAERVVNIQRIMQAASPALLSAVEFEHRSFILKELQPVVDRLDFASWREKPHRLMQAMEGMGRVAAWAHLRGCGHYGTGSVESLQAFVAGHRWRIAADSLATTAAARIVTAWKRYAKDYDLGKVAAAVKAP